MHHAAALAWLDGVQEDGDVILCASAGLDCCLRSTILTLLGADIPSGSEAWETWDAFFGDQRFRFDEKADGFESRFRALCGSFAQQHKRWQDAYFAAFALAARSPDCISAFSWLEYADFWWNPQVKQGWARWFTPWSVFNLGIRSSTGWKFLRTTERSTGSVA